MGQASFKSAGVEGANGGMSPQPATASVAGPNTPTTVTRDPATGRPLDKDGKPLKPCCVCPDTKRIRDECMLRTGDEQACCKEIEAHKACLRALGFNI